ncbi:gamma-glutamyltransferase family protein [Nonomuraea sp. K274]|uniref:Gamma-glutamyltransferase family protein n=1 Tax=Nonomuraea cypriaca TaxID=1187855 RepID=A0A931A351_9ACTN|nr:gamma-glutamyltransferase family protein [Nonomuraea cypriaca]MBF8184213.1 gamma-glutamyltransferase family protein [Nonomuraea cypriaca]
MPDDPARRLSHRPPIRARHYLAASGNYLATVAAMRILDRGGNATDAGVAAGICLNVLMPDLTNFGGVAPIIAYDRGRNELRSISGLGPWARDVTLEAYRERWGDRIPPGVARCVVPGAPSAWLTALARFGTMSFAEIAQPALELCERGFPVYPSLQRSIRESSGLLRTWPSNAEIFLRGGGEPEIGGILVQADMGRTFRTLIAAEEKANGTREEKIEAAHDEFYQGEIAETIAAFVSDGSGFMSLSDLAGFRAEVETPVSTSYRGIDVYMCGPWCQGPVLGQALNILEGFALAGMEHNSADHLHVVAQSLNLAFADRDAYYADPRFADVPIERLMSKEYAAYQRARISMERAFDRMPAGGLGLRSDRAEPGPQPERSPFPQPDTSYVCVVDRDGNAFSATPSDGMVTSPIVPGLGLLCSGRGYQSWLDPAHPARIEGGKRPRLTPSPAMAFRDGKLLMPFGTPGHDMQPQAMVQAFVNIVDFGMEVQEAIEQPRVATSNFPGTGWPHPYTPAGMGVEGRIPQSVVDDLARRGHVIEQWPRWSRRAGNICAIVVDHDNGALCGGADARAEAYALGW